MARLNPGTLPVPATSLVGRRGALKEIRRALRVTQLLTLAGPGGIGKSRLAVAVGESLEGRFADGTWFIDLTGMPAHMSVEDYVLDIVTGPDHSRRRSEQRLVNHLRLRSALLIFDNCESFMEPVISLITTVLSAAPEVRVLATSREASGSVRERVMQVGPLDVPSPDAIADVPKVAQSDAVKLLLERAAVVRPDFRLDTRNCRAIAQVCRRLEGNPLAIELVAPRLRTLTLCQLLETLDDRLSIAAHDLSTPSRHRSIRDMIGWSWDLCTDAERLLWRRCSIFAGGFDLRAAQAVCSGEGLARDGVWEVIDRLVAKSLIGVTSRGDSVRLQLLETIAEFGREQLSVSGEANKLAGRHFEYFAAIARNARESWNTADQAEIVAMMRTERSNFALALEWSLTRGQVARRGCRLATDLRVHWAIDGFLRDGSRWMRRVLHHTVGQTVERADALWVLGWISLLRGDPEAVELSLQEAREIADQLSDERLTAHVELFAGTAALWRGDHEQARRRLHDAYTWISAECSPAPGPYFAAMMLALALAEAGDFARLAELESDRRDDIEAGLDRWGLSQMLWALAYATWLAGDREGALAKLCDSFALNLPFDRVGTALKADTMAWVATSAGEHERGCVLLGAADAIWSDLGTSIAAFGCAFGDHAIRCRETLERTLPHDEMERLLRTGAKLDYEALYARATKPGAPAAGPDAQPTERLTRREREVSHLIADGLSNRQIAARLVVSPRTVEGHVARILDKLGFASRTQVATSFALQRAQPSTSTATNDD